MNLGKLNGKIAEVGMKKKVLADFLGITPQALGKKLSGKTKMTTDDAIKFCDALLITDNNEKCDIFLRKMSQ